MSTYWDISCCVCPIFFRLLGERVPLFMPLSLLDAIGDIMYLLCVGPSMFLCVSNVCFQKIGAKT